MDSDGLSQVTKSQRNVGLDNFSNGNGMEPLPAITQEITINVGGAAAKDWRGVQPSNGGTPACFGCFEHKGWMYCVSSCSFTAHLYTLSEGFPSLLSVWCSTARRPRSRFVPVQLGKIRTRPQLLEAVVVLYYRTVSWGQVIIDIVICILGWATQSRASWGTCAYL